MHVFSLQIIGPVQGELTTGGVEKASDFDSSGLFVVICWCFANNGWHFELMALTMQCKKPYVVSVGAGSHTSSLNRQVLSF